MAAALGMNACAVVLLSLGCQWQFRNDIFNYVRSDETVYGKNIWDVFAFCVRDVVE